MRRVTSRWPRRTRGTCWCCGTAYVPVRMRTSRPYQISPYKPAVDGGRHLWCARCEREAMSSNFPLTSYEQEGATR